LDAIIVSLIGLAGSAIGSILGVLASARLTSYRLEQLEKRVQAHNNLIERMYQVEERTELQEEKIKAANRRIENLERRADAS
jgi:predicted acylesterase/phospholipase RssA